MNRAIRRHPEQPLVVSPAEGQQLLGIGHSTFAKLLARGDLKSTRIGARRLVYYDSILALLAAGEGAPDQAA
ncbi:MAG: helix-turn-helix domain-containing protein [Proteobacteria bacterium]|nr:helix-turn-helix domain-containing protein [Pseudomonadota bacterium]